MKNYKLIKIICTSFILFFGASVIADEAKIISTKTHKEGEYRGAKTATHPDWFKESFLDLEEDIADAAQQKKRLVIYFWQPGCPYCSQLWEENFAKQDIVDYFRKNFEIIALNMWGDREVVSVGGNDYTEKSFADALGIKYTPTLLFFDENKKVVHRLNGYIPPKSFKLALEYVAGHHEKEQSYGAYVASRQKKLASGSGALIKEDFFSALPESKDLSDLISSKDKQKDKQKGKYLAVYFEAKNCENCTLLHEKTLKDPATRKLAKQFVSVQLDRYSDDEIIVPGGEKLSIRDWANKLNISYLPAMIFFNDAGKEVMRIDAQMRTFHVQSVFDYVLSGSYKTEPNFQRYISARADEIRKKGISVDIWAY